MSFFQSFGRSKQFFFYKTYRPSTVKNLEFQDEIQGGADFGSL